MNNIRTPLLLVLILLGVFTMVSQPVAAVDITESSEVGDSNIVDQQVNNENNSDSTVSTSSTTAAGDNNEITVETGRVTTQDGTRNVSLVVGVTNTSGTIQEGVSAIDLSIEIEGPDGSTKTFSRTTNGNGITALEYNPALEGEYNVQVDSPEISDTEYTNFVAGQTRSFFPGWHDAIEIDRKVTVGVGVLDGGSAVDTSQQTVNISTPSDSEITKTFNTDQTGTATFNFTPKEAGEYRISRTSGNNVERQLNLEAGDVTGKVQFNSPFADYIKSGQTAAVYGQLKDGLQPYANEEINVSIVKQEDTVVYSEVTQTNDEGLFVIDWETPSDESYYRISISTPSDESVAVHGTGIDVETADDDSPSPTSIVDLTVDFDEKDYSPTFKPGEQATANIRVTNDSEPASNVPISYRGTIGYPGAVIVGGNTTTNSTGYATVTFTVPEDAPRTEDFEFDVYTSVNGSTFDETEYGDINDIKWDQDNDYSTSPKTTINYSTTATDVSTGDGVADVPTQVFLESNAFHASVISADLAKTGADGTDRVQFTAPNKTGELFFGDWGPYRSPNSFRSIDSEVYDVTIDADEEYSQGETVNISYSTDTNREVSANVLIAAGDDDYEQIDTESGLLYSGRVKSGANITFTVPQSAPTDADYRITVSSSSATGNRTVEYDEFDVAEGDDTGDDGDGGGGGGSGSNVPAAPAIGGPSDFTYDPSSAVTLGTGHNATGIIDSDNVAVRLVNITNGNSTEVALNDSDAVPVLGLVNTTIPREQLAGDVTIEMQLYNTSAETVAATTTVNLTAGTFGNRAPYLADLEDATYDPNNDLTIGTFHNATGVIGDEDVAIRLLNATAGNSTEIARNESVPIKGEANTTTSAGALSGNVTVEIQLYNTSSGTEVADSTLNLTANGSQLVVQIDTDNNNRIGDFEILQAIEYWRTNQDVPNTNQTISDQEILTLIDMWQEETEVAA